MASAGNFESALTAWSTLALAVIALVALIGTAVGLYQARREAKRARAYEYMRRLYSIELLPVVTRAQTFLRTPAKASTKRVRCWQRTPVKRAQAQFESMKPIPQAEIILVLNFFEELSGMYKSGLLDEGITRDMLAPAAVSVWRQAEWLIDYLRDETRRQRGPDAAAKILNRWQWFFDEFKAPD